MEKERIHVGLVGVGLHTYWSQFAGLRERLCGYQHQIAERVARPDIQLVDAGIVDTPEKASLTARNCNKRAYRLYGFISPHTPFLLRYFLSYSD